VEDALGTVQNVVVLGGTSEIALATIERLAQDRCRHAVLAVRDPDASAEAKTTLERVGVVVDIVAFEATATDTHRGVIDDAFDRLGDVDLVLLAFGVLGNQDAFDADPVQAADAVAVNLGGAVSVGLVVADRLRAQGHGTLAVLSSVAGERVRSENAVYGATKAGLDGFAQALGDRLAGSGARVMIVRPGFVHTRMTAGLDPAPLSTTPEAVADDIATGLRKQSAIVWSPGALRWLFTVLRHLPRPLWRRITADR
jgi:decaprenylphospho-beta-D-erythro-pentofuranosid-2-ulose 2-reductase